MACAVFQFVQVLGLGVGFSVGPNYEAFLKAFEKLPDQLPEFTLETWHGLVDYVTVYAEDDIRFTFKNGQEVKA